MDIKIKRHSLAHIMAMAIKESFPGLKFGMGPAIENGFYYDFEFVKDDKKKSSEISSNDLPKIEKRMKSIIGKNLKFEKKEISKIEAKKIFKDQPYKLELINEIKNQKVSTYKCGNFIDLCNGPHIDKTKDISNDAFCLTKIAGAYWRGNEANPMLVRIYGVAFETKKELDKYLKLQEEAEKRDHRKLGKELDLFSFHKEAPGMPFFHPKGMIILNILVERWRIIQKKYGYMEVRMPFMLDENLWKQSGHYDHYKDSMFFIKTNDKKLALRPMDCPGTILFYKEDIRSYNDLPLKWSELGTVFRNEKSGELNGLFRAQQITQDDAHIFISEKMIEKEISEVLKIIENIYAPFNIEKKIFLSTRPDNAMGNVKIWNKAEKALKNALKKNNIKYGIKEKDGAFYGPKIDIEICDSLKRTWQTGTIQLDFFMPEKFNISYVDEKGKKKRPVIIHRALMGSLERFIGIITEHYAGAFPFWLSPIQVSIIPVSEKHIKYAKKIEDSLLALDFRTELKDENETLSKKIREGEIQKTPYLLVVGDKEIETESVSVRERKKGNVGKIKITKFLEKIKKLQKEKKSQ